MKHPQDIKTFYLADSIKRGRGRPRVENPLTPAERARRYREAQARKRAQITQYQSNQGTAHVIALGDRFFLKFDKAGKVQTAWSLAGASLYGHGSCQKKLASVFRKLQTAGKNPVLLTIGVIAPAMAF